MPGPSKSFVIENYKKPEPVNFKMTDYRRDLHIRHKREVHARKERLKAIQDSKYVSRFAVTVDTSRARSNNDVVRMSVKELGFKEYPFGRKDHSCDIHWHAMNFDENSEVYGGKINKFPGMNEICSKMSLFRCLDNMRELFPSEYDFYPRTWYLPQQFHEFSCQTRKQTERKVKPKPTYIIKPDTGAQGEGIYLVRDPAEYSTYSNRCHVAQEYLWNVYLIDRFKFDFRVYVTLKCLEPLEFYICKEGLARFSTVPYENPTVKNIHETFMHLTNYSLNKRSSTFNRSERDDEGSKRTLTSVLRKLSIDGHDSDLVWTNIEQIVCKTLIAIVPEMKVEFQAAVPPGKPGPSCFQILGFDILLLENLKPMLLEVNASPSLSIESEQEVAPGVVEYVPSAKDEEVKRPLVRDTMLLVAPQHKLRYWYRDKLRRRLKKKKKSREEIANLLKRRPEPVQHQRTTILIIKADESDEEKREIDVTQQMSEISTEVDNVKTGSRESSARETVHSEEDEIENEREIEAEVENYYSKKMKESCLKKLYPGEYEEDYERYRVLDRVAGLFIYSLGVRGSLRIGPTGFRTFARKCRLNRKGMTNAAVDIMYIDLQRKWDHMNPDRTAGLCYQGFLDACMEIAKRKFYALNKIEMLESLVEYCELNLNTKDDDMSSNLPRLHFRRLGLQYRQGSLYAMPRRTMVEMSEETTIEELVNAHERRMRQNSQEEIDCLLRHKKRSMYKAPPYPNQKRILQHSEEE